MACLGLIAQLCAAENPPKVALDNNEALFTVLTAINACGYDSDLSVSDPLRAEIRAEVAKTTEGSSEAKESTAVMCQFYAEHQQDDPARTLAQYVSLALCLNPPPELTFKVKETELPPDASFVSGFVPALQKFYGEAGLHSIWTRHQAAYADLTARYHEPLSKVLFDTEVYLKLPSAGFLGRAFTVYLDPMGSPGQANARNYGSDYYVVISPGTNSSLKIDQIRHECLIRAIEARTIGTSKTPETQRQQLVQQSAEQGFILTPYFYQALLKFEKSPTGLRLAYGDLISGIDVRKEQRNVAQIKFASKADPELLHLSRPADTKLLISAEQRLSTGDPEGAKKLAQQALDEKKEDPGRALFILAQVATMNRDMQGARNYFQQALGVAHEPKVVAWSHIYLGRIFDLQEDREAALDQYRAALSAGGSLPEAKAAAEHGIEQPYEPPSHPQQ